MWKTLFWPGMVTILSLSILAIWFHHNSVEFKLRQDALNVLSDDHAWADVRLSGRDLTLNGVSPSKEAQQDAKDRLSTLKGVRIVIDQSSLLPLVEPFVTLITLNAGEVRITGHLASLEARSDLIKLLSQAVPAVSILDETQLARGGSDRIMVLIEKALREVTSYSSWGIEISDDEVKISTPRDAG
ncbi:MAG: hypothetical protein JJ858_11560 [Rhizobiaceae bacterium]|nr:hypothetical protein [Rhizobiaceae bacterium]